MSWNLVKKKDKTESQKTRMSLHLTDKRTDEIFLKKWRRSNYCSPALAIQVALVILWFSFLKWKLTMFYFQYVQILCTLFWRHQSKSIASKFRQ